MTVAEPSSTRLASSAKSRQGSDAVAPQPSAPETSSTLTWSANTPLNAASEAAPWLRRGSQGEAVTQLQTRLKQLGYDPGTVDGTFGSLTQAAVIRFQQAHQLTADGVVGAATWAKLRQLSTPARPAPLTPSKPPSDRPPTPSPTPALPESEFITPPPSPTEVSPPPSPPSNSSLDAQKTRRVYTSPTPTGSYIWFLGWLVIYTGGWVLIFKDLVKELRGFPVKVAPQQQRQRQRQRQHQPATPPSHITRSPQADQPPVVVSPVHPPSESADANGKTHVQPITQAQLSVVDASPVISTASALVRDEPPAPTVTPTSSESSEIDTAWADQALMIAQADRGIARPLENLFVGLHQPAPPQITRRKGNRVTSSLPPNPVTQPTAQTAKVEPIASSSPAHDVSIEGHPEETLIAKLPLVSEHQEPCTYALIHDPSGLFVLRENELRVVNSRLTAQNIATSHVITVRRTDAKGEALDKSFKLEIKKTGQKAGSITMPVPA